MHGKNKKTTGSSSNENRQILEEMKRRKDTAPNGESSDETDKMTVLLNTYESQTPESGNPVVQTATESATGERDDVLDDEEYRSIKHPVKADFDGKGGILEDVQKYMTQEHSASLIQSASDADNRQHVISLIANYIKQKGYYCEGMHFQTLVGKLYDYMAGTAFLEEMIRDPDTEEVNINSWDDIEIIRSSTGSVTEKVDQHFSDPEQARNIVARMISTTGKVLDGTTPKVIANYDTNIRIAATIPPLVDKEIGVSASIRIVNQKLITEEMLLANGSATKGMLFLLRMFVLYGVSSCIAGATSSGKTTYLQYLLSQIPNNIRVITMEDGARELNLHRTDSQGRKINSVIHQITRPSENNDVRDISQNDLLELDLRMHPQILAVGEIRAAKECMAVAEAARTGVTCFTTIHSESAADTYLRMMTLAKRENRIEDRMLLLIMAQAFPVIIYMQQLANGQRRIMEIVEAERIDGDEVKTRTLYRYVIERNIRHEDGTVETVGRHVCENHISDKLKHKLLNRGISDTELAQIDRYAEEEAEANVNG